MENITLTCATCDTTKPASDFHKDKSRSRGYDRHCKECSNARRAARYRRANPIQKATPKKVFECAECGKQFQPHRKTQRYCSNPCAGIARRLDRGKLQRPGRRRNRTRESVQLSIKPCSTCGNMFAPSRAGNVNCSPECTAKSRRMAEHRRSHMRRVWSQLTRTEMVDPVDIYERDEWQCGICDKPIDKTLKYPDMGSASLDHIRPLSWGGPHIAENLTASHLWCNLSKRDTGELDEEAKAFRAKSIKSIKDMFNLHGDWIPSATHEEIMVDTQGRTYNIRTGRMFRKETAIDGKQIRRSIVVAETFTGPRPRPSCYVVHKNGDETDFTPSNLEWKRPKRQAKQTHCRRGHEKAGANLLGNGGCRSCNKATSNKGKRRDAGSPRVVANLHPDQVGQTTVEWVRIQVEWVGIWGRLRGPERV